MDKVRPQIAITFQDLRELKLLHKQSASHLKAGIQILIPSKQSKAFGKYRVANALLIISSNVRGAP